MKKIKVKDQYQPFKAVLDGSTSIPLDHEWSVANEGIVNQISQRWGALVDIEEIPLEEAIPHIQAESESAGETPEAEEDIKPKRKKKE